MILFDILNSRYLLREETLLEYIVFFVYSAVNIQLNAAFLFASDAGFFGINLYLAAAFEDLIDNFKEIENIEYGNQIRAHSFNYITLTFVFTHHPSRTVNLPKRKARRKNS